MKEYIAKKTSDKLTIDDKRWENVPAAELSEGWWQLFPKKFRTLARLVHSDDGLILRMETDEWPIRINATKLNEEVCLDSCMEFFFTPNTKDTEYMNIEANAASVPLCGIGGGREGRRGLSPCSEGVEFRTLIDFEKGWKLWVFIPYSFMLAHFSSVEKEMRANFYKCGEETAVEHYSVWNKINTPEPDYHRPEYLGRIILGDETV